MDLENSDIFTPNSPTLLNSRTQPTMCLPTVRFYLTFKRSQFKTPRPRGTQLRSMWIRNFVYFSLYTNGVNKSFLRVMNLLRRLVWIKAWQHWVEMGVGGWIRGGATLKKMGRNRSQNKYGKSTNLRNLLYKYIHNTGIFHRKLCSYMREYMYMLEGDQYRISKCFIWGDF